MSSRLQKRLRGGRVTAQVVASLLALGLGGGPGRAWADVGAPRAADPNAVAQARVHFTRAVKLYEEDDFRAALIEFNRAYELAPNWAVLYNVGQSYYQLRDYPNALGTMEKYLSQGGASIPADRRAQVTREIDELRGRVARVTIQSNVVGADVTVDDVALGRTPLVGPQLVGAGRHAFKAAKTGAPVITQVVDIAGGDNLTVTLNAAPPPRVVVVTVIAPPPPPPSHVPAIVALGVGGAGIVTGAVFGVLAITNKSSLNSECSGKACPPSAQGDINAYSRNGAISTVAFSVGGAGVVAAVFLYFTERGKETGPSPSPVAAPSASVRVTPFLGLGGVGLHGTF